MVGSIIILGKFKTLNYQGFNYFLMIAILQSLLHNNST